MPAIQIAWILLGVSVTAEVLGTIGLKISDGFTHVLPTAFTALTSLVGVTWFGESVTSLKLPGLALAVVSLVVLNLSESPP